MKLHMKNSKVWKTCIEAVSALVDEAAFKVTPEGMKLKAMDPSHVALVDLDMPAKAFDEFEATKETTIGVNLEEMSKALSRAKPKDELTIEFDESTNRLALTFSGPPVRHISTPTLDVKAEEYPEPKLQLTATAQATAGTIQDGIKDAELVGETVTLALDADSLVMVAESDKGSAELRLSKGDKALVSLDTKLPARSMYNTKSLGDILKAAAPDDVVTVNIGTNLPVQIDYPITNGRLRFLLAPRIEAE